MVINSEIFIVNILGTHVWLDFFNRKEVAFAGNQFNLRIKSFNEVLNILIQELHSLVLDFEAVF